MSSSYDNIRATDDRPRETYDWNGTEVVLAGLAHEDQEWILELMMHAEGKEMTLETIRKAPEIVVRGVLDPATGERMFTDADTEWLKRKAKIGDIATKIVELTPLMGTDEDVDEAKNVSAPVQES